MTEPEIKPVVDIEREVTFTEPWQAEALAVVDALVRQGVLTAPQWSAALGEQLQQAEAMQQADNVTTYYQAVLAALETLMTGQKLIEVAELTARKEDWEKAYLSTPHGQPVRLAAGMA